MASATTRPTFSFHLSSSSLTQPSPSSPKPKPNLTFPLLLNNTHSFPSLIHKHPNPKLTRGSIDVSKEDKPISEPTTNSATPLISSDSDSPPPPPPPPPAEEPTPLDKRRLEEKFVVVNTGIYQCRSCGYRYDEAAGDPAYPVPPGMQFGKLPEDWRCPTCGAAQSFFESKSVEIAGFAQNQQFGLGGNTLTSGQKAVLIYGGLFLGFVLFLSGYFLQ